MPLEMQKSPTSRTSSSSSEAYHLSSDQLEERPDSPKHDWSLSASQEAQQLSAKSPREEQILFPTPKSPTSRTSTASSEVHEAPSDQLEESEDSPKHDRSLSLSYEEVQQLSTSLPIEEEIPFQIPTSPTSRTNTVSSEIHQAPSDHLEKRQEFPKHSRSPSSSEEETEQLFTRSVVWQQSLFEIPKLPGSRTSSASSEVYQLPSNQLEDRLESPKHDRPMSSLQERQQMFTESPIEEQIPFEKEESATSPTNSVSSKDLSASSEPHHLFSHQLEEPEESPENYRSLSTSQEEVHQLARKLSIDEEKSSTSPGTTTAAMNLSMTPEDDRLSSMQSTDQYEPMASSQLLSFGSGKRPESLELRESITSPKEESKQIIAASPMEEPVLPESDNSTASSTNTTSLADQLSSFKTTQSSSYDHPIISNVSQSNPIESSNVLSQEDPSISSNIQRKSWTPLEEYLTSSELEKFPVNDENVQEHFSSTPSDEYRIESPIGKVDNDKQLAESSDEYDNDTEYDDKTKSSSSYAINQASNEKLDSINRQSRLPSIEEHETNQFDKEERSSFDLSKTSFSEVKQNINSPKTNELILEEDLTSPEEQISSSDYNPIEEDSGIGYISSSGYYGTLNDSNPLTNQDLNKEVPYQTSLTDVDADNIDLSEKINNSTSSKTEEDDCDVTNESNLETVMQDLRYVYRDLANDEDLVEINTEFPDSLIDRLEFGDNFIRTLFDDFLRKYLVQPAQYEIRSKTLDWNEFRDILFPILTGRYMEKHIRKLFDLFDTTKDGYLTLQEIIALFELLQVANTAELAQYMITEFDKNQDGKLNINEFLEIVKKTSDVTNNILSEKIEYRPWYNRHPIDDDGDNNDDDDDLQSISLEVPVINFERKPNADIINNEIFLLGRIFKKVGGDVENKQLDSTKPTLSMKITNEFIHNNVHISNDDLNLFIDLYLTKKQNSGNHLINWTEFRDIFLPLVNGGMIDKHEISHWFDILDINHNRTITNEQTLLLLRLLQISNPDDILNKMNEISQTYINNNGTWTLEELIFALENIDETTSHLCSINEKIKSFDRAWLTKNIF
ncbi:unnamed protein product [Adineta steineri]|nr:unnamed protein product [Adineta steineri]